MNLQPNEVIIIAVLALMILGPDHLPGALRKIGKTLGELRKISDGFQSEIRHAFEDADEAEAARNAGVASYTPPAAQPESSQADDPEIEDERAPQDPAANDEKASQDPAAEEQMSSQDPAAEAEAVQEADVDE